MGSLIIGAGLIIAAFYFKVIMDVSSIDGFAESFWNRTQSWERKYAFPLVKKYKHWYYLGIYTPKYKEKFPFSSTLLIFITDGWHLSQALFLSCMFAAIAVNTTYPVYSFIGIWVIYGIVFNMIYNSISK